MLVFAQPSAPQPSQTDPVRQAHPRALPVCTAKEVVMCVSLARGAGLGTSDHILVKAVVRTAGTHC